MPTIAECGSKYAVIVGTASAYGKDLLPRVAGRLGSGYASDISELLTDMPDGVCALNAMLYKRPMYAGNVYGLVKIATPNHVVSVRQSAFTAAEPSEAVASIEQVAVAVAGESVNRIEFVSFDRSRAQDLC